MSVSLLLTWKQEMIRVQNIRVFWLTALFLILLYLHRSHGDAVSKQCIFPYLSVWMHLTHFCVKNSILHRRSIWNTSHEIKTQKSPCGIMAESTSPAFAFAKLFHLYKACKLTNKYILPKGESPFCLFKSPSLSTNTFCGTSNISQALIFLKATNESELVGLHSVSTLWPQTLLSLPFPPLIPGPGNPHPLLFAPPTQTPLLTLPWNPNEWIVHT